MDIQQAKALLQREALPVIEIAPGMTVTNPRLFIESHLIVIEHGRNRQPPLHYERLEKYINKLQNDSNTTN